MRLVTYPTRRDGKKMLWKSLKIVLEAFLKLFLFFLIWLVTAEYIIIIIIIIIIINPMISRLF
jgi:hypothetical protein